MSAGAGRDRLSLVRLAWRGKSADASAMEWGSERSVKQAGESSPKAPLTGLPSAVLWVTPFSRRWSEAPADSRKSLAVVSADRPTAARLSFSGSPRKLREVGPFHPWLCLPARTKTCALAASILRTSSSLRPALGLPPPTFRGCAAAGLLLSAHKKKERRRFMALALRTVAGRLATASVVHDQRAL